MPDIKKKSIIHFSAQETEGHVQQVVERNLSLLWENIKGFTLMSMFNIRLSLNNLLLCLIKKKEKKRK